MDTRQMYLLFFFKIPTFYTNIHNKIGSHNYKK